MQSGSRPKIIYRPPAAPLLPRGYTLRPEDVDRLIVESGSTNRKFAARLASLGFNIDHRRLSNWRSGARKAPKAFQVAAAMSEASRLEYAANHPDEADAVALIASVGLPVWAFTGSPVDCLRTSQR